MEKRSDMTNMAKSGDIYTQVIVVARNFFCNTRARSKIPGKIIYYIGTDDEI